MLFCVYQASDAAACLELFNSNTPAFFAPSEREDFTAYLAEAPHYFVLVLNERIVGCGGLEEVQDGAWVLCWGMVDQSLHRQGLGKPCCWGA